MTVHKLACGRATECGLKVPSIIALPLGATTWNDGDEVARGLCHDGCWDLGETAPATPVPQPAALQRFNAMTKTRDGQAMIGVAIVNRDRSIVVHLTSLPIDGKLTLVPT